MGAGNSATLRDLRVFAEEATEPITSDHLDYSVSRIGKLWGADIQFRSLITGSALSPTSRSEALAAGIPPQPRSVIDGLHRRSQTLLELAHAWQVRGQLRQARLRAFAGTAVAAAGAVLFLAATSTATTTKPVPTPIPTTTATPTATIR